MVTVKWTRSEEQMFVDLYHNRLLRGLCMASQKVLCLDSMAVDPKKIEK